MEPCSRVGADLKTNLSEFFAKVAIQASLFDEPVLAQLCRMAAIEAEDTSVRFKPPWGSIIGIWDWDVKNDRNHADPDCAALFGIDPSKAAGGLTLGSYLTAVHPDDVKGLSDKIEVALKGGVLEAEYRVVSGNRTKRVFAKGFCSLDQSNRPARLPGAIIEL
jgi:PAS domain-containing protein